MARTPDPLAVGSLALDLCKPRPASLPEVVAELTAVLRESLDFANHLMDPEVEMLERS